MFREVSVIFFNLLNTTPEWNTLGWRGKTYVANAVTDHFSFCWLPLICTLSDRFDICKLSWTVTPDRLGWTRLYFIFAVKLFFDSLIYHVCLGSVRGITVFTFRICQVRIHRHLCFVVAVSGHLIRVFRRVKFKAHLNRPNLFLTLLLRLVRIIAFLSRLWPPFFTVIIWWFFFRPHVFDSLKCFLDLFQVGLVLILLILCALEHFFWKITEFLQLSGFSRLKLCRTCMGWAWFWGLRLREKIWVPFYIEIHHRGFPDNLLFGLYHRALQNGFGVWLFNRLWLFSWLLIKQLVDFRAIWVSFEFIVLVLLWDNLS